MKHILLIDDNPLNNFGYIEDLEKHYSVDVAMRLVSAERLLRSRKYDIIVIDVMMPTQRLGTHNETTTGFSFYKEKLTKMNLNCIVVFWSRLGESFFKEYWRDNPPKNTFFIQKNDSNNHLTNKVNEILNEMGIK